MIAALLFLGLGTEISAAQFQVTTIARSGPGSLAQAIKDANARSGADEITFAIPGGGVHKVVLDHDTALPAITDTVTIDGYTQAGAKPNTLALGDDAVILIELNGGGSAAGVPTGLSVAADDCVIRGLAFTGFSAGNAGSPVLEGTAIAVASDSFQSGNRTRVEGNFIGLSPDGVAEGNLVGVDIVSGEGSSVGGALPQQRNVIAGNRFGVRAFRSAPSWPGTTSASGSTEWSRASEIRFAFSRWRMA